MKLEPGSIVHQASRIASRVIEGQAVVIVMDEQRLHTLNEVGTFVWTQAEKPIRVEEIVERVRAEYDVSPEQAMSDVVAFTDELVRLGAFEVVEP